MTVQKTTRPRSLKPFLVIWIGQTISLLGSGLTNFAMGIWIYEKGGQVLPFAITAILTSVPALLVSPIAGSVVDRFSRKKIMILADTGDAILTAVMAGLILTDSLQLWQIYTLVLISSVLGAFQEPAYSASITMLVPKEDLGRANGIQETGGALRLLLTPLIAGGLYGLVGFGGIITIDLVTFVFALSALFSVAIPQPEREPVDGGQVKSVWQDAVFGWRFLRTKSGLFGLMWYMASVNFFLNATSLLTVPLVMSFGTSLDLGVVQVLIGAGALAGGLLISIWGGPKRQKHLGIMGGLVGAGLGMVIVGWRPNTWMISGGYFLMMAMVPIASSLGRSIFQARVPPSIQGRVFSIRLMISRSIVPVAYLLSGFLADQFFVPLLEVGGALSNTVIGTALGVGDGRGYGLISILAGLSIWGITFVAFLNKRIQRIDEEIPDAVEKG
jgi:MFS family permease